MDDVKLFIVSSVIPSQAILSAWNRLVLFLQFSRFIFINWIEIGRLSRPIKYLNPVILQTFFAYFGGVLRVIVLLKPPLKRHFLCVEQHYVLQYITMIHKSIHNAIIMMIWPYSLTRKTAPDHYTSNAMFECFLALHGI